MTSSHDPSTTRAKRLAAPASGRSRGRAVEIGGGVQMSCQELDDDHAVIRFAWPGAARRRGRGLTRET
ncbi:MAG TPA: hypothetical protein VI456_04085 [Polyangia bacterium]